MHINATELAGILPCSTFDFADQQSSALHVSTNSRSTGLRTKQLMHFPVSMGENEDFLATILEAAKNKCSEYVCVANVHMFIEAYRSLAFLDVIKSSFLVTPDGRPISWSLNFLYKIRQNRIAGMDLVPELLAMSNENNIPVFFYGGSEEMLSKTRSVLDLRYKNLSVAGMYSPPYHESTDEEDQAIINTINESGAKIVFVVLGCPKQEKWMAKMKGKVHAVMIGVGGAIPVLAGMQKRAPVWMQNRGLEWFYRLSLEPQRLWRRYLYTNTFFIYLLLKEKIKTTIS